MNLQQRREYWLRFHRFQKRYEAIYTSKIKKALQSNVTQYLKNQNINDVTSAPMHFVLTDLYKTTGKTWAAYTNSTLPKKRKARMPMGFSERIVELMRIHFGLDLLNHSEGITDKTKEIIEKILGNASELGLSFDETVRMLRESTELGTTRARTIARTETVGAANGASMINAMETGLELNKVWISAKDNRTRRTPRDEFDHLHMDGITIAHNDLFKVHGKENDDLLQYPGDRRSGADPGNIVNCRCCIAHSVIE